MKTRDAAEHSCPGRPKAERTMPLAARSISALQETIAGFFPPISGTVGRTHLLLAKPRKIFRPTS
jgi:hypothetical protein